MSFNRGDVVRWNSQASGTSLVKTGTVVDVISAGSKPLRIYRSLYRCNGVDGVRTRNGTSYVVCVELKGKVPLQFKYYWPKVNLLNLVSRGPNEERRWNKLLGKGLTPVEALNAINRQDGIGDKRGLEAGNTELDDERDPDLAEDSDYSDEYATAEQP